ncbi:MAG TPA: hypothetical protein VME40_18225 [Caulobacteraceae bacterium]|nr:hypothetical protein [Caulobacteraceae bacterium]
MDDEAPESDSELRAELMQARDRVRRELEILSAPSSIGGPPDNAGAVADLRRELAELEAALGRLD